MQPKTRSRSRLHHSHLEAFKAYLVELGWVEEPTKGIYEKLRMRHPRYNDPLIVHSKEEATQHYTTWGHSDRLATGFLNQKRRETNENSRNEER